MSVEVLPLGVRCNIACTYCYQHPMRPGERERPYDMDAMLSSLRDETSGDFTVFGGEPLMMPIEDLGVLLRASHERGGKSGVQTNATLITPAHIELFRQYATHVGVSMDGPVELNDARWAGSVERTREQTALSEQNLRELLAQRIPSSLIVTISTMNASPTRLDALVEWLRSLGQAGLRHARLHLLEVDSPRAAAIRLSDQDAIAAMRRMHAEEPFLGGLSFDVFDEGAMLLRGRDEGVSCTWNACDPWTTAAVRGVGPRGERLNCGRTNKDARNWLKSEQPSHRRQLVLYSTPRADGGCSGCRFFVVCKGQCPGEAIGGDFRNRSSNCDIWTGVFEMMESFVLAARETPVSLHPNRADLEQAMLGEWANGRNCSISRGIRIASGEAQQARLEVDGHGDVPHGDSHGDHTDAH